jgi:hypothetical protein
LTELILSASLFDLMSLAGSASLDELRARSSVDNITLANTVATMVASGRVTLSINPEFNTDHEPADNIRKDMIRSLGEATGEFRRVSIIDRDVLKEAIQGVLETNGTAAFVTVIPTSRGFKSIL